MRFKKVLTFSTLVFSYVLITFVCESTAFSQNTEQERPKIKDFGKSLRKKVTEDNTELTKSSNNDDDVIKVETNLVRTDVLVIDQKGQAVLELKPEDFIVTENNIPQVIGTFSRGDSAEISRSIVLIIDYSGSQIPYIQTSVEAAKVLVNKLNPKDRMAIVTDDVELLVEFTRDRELLKKRLDSLAKSIKGSGLKQGKTGKSLQYSALMATLRELFDSEDIRPIVIFQTDGDQFFNIKPANPLPNQRPSLAETSFTDKELIETIEKSRATIFSVISGDSFVGLSPEDRLKKSKMIVEKRLSMPHLKLNLLEIARRESDRRYVEQKIMESVARTSGGFTEMLEKPEQANEIYTRILNGINYRYLIGYYPTNQVRDGKRRNVKIEVRGHHEYIVWGRKTYIATQ